MYDNRLIVDAEKLLELCRRHELTLATAESCTGGLIAGLLTEILGSSDVVDCGFVTYSNRAKQAMLGVPQTMLEQHGAVSEPVARAMAEGVLAHCPADLALAVTGIAGPGGGTETVILRRLSRPDAFDTFFASERVLEVLRPSSLTKVAKVLFFARWNRDSAGGEESDRLRVCLLIEGESRAILFDQVGFSVAATSRVAEVAGMMVAAFAFHRDKLFYLDQVLEDTTVAALEEAVPRLRSLPWRTLEHPAAFFNVFDDWDGRLRAFAERPGHPMAELVRLAEATGMPCAWQPSPAPWP